MEPKYIQLPPLPLDLPTEVIEMIWLYTRLSGEEQEMIRDFIRENLKRKIKILMRQACLKCWRILMGK